MERYSRNCNEKIESYSKNTDETTDDISRKVDEMLENSMLVSNIVGSDPRDVKTTKKNMLMRIKEKVTTGFHCETTEVTQLSREMINEIGMDFGRAKIECSEKPISHDFMDNGERNKFIRSANMLKRESRWRKISITNQWLLKKDSTTKEWDMSNIALIRDTTCFSAWSTWIGLPNTCQSRDKLW